MRALMVGAFVWIAAAAVPARAGTVTVTFVDFERFTDASDRARTTEQTVREIEEQLKKLGERYLPAQAKLRIEVLDIDLAGEARFASRADPELRVLNGRSDWPRMRVRHALEAGGQVSGPIEETISDPAYLERPEPRAAATTLAYEKRMLDEWFRKRFAPERTAR